MASRKSAAAFLFTLALLVPITFAQKLSSERILLRTNLGDVTFALYPEVAPLHTAQIIKLVELGIYEGSDIFRIERGFVAQIENFNMRKLPLPTEKQRAVMKIPAEFSTIPHVRGIVSMARLDDINSAESSFSLILGEAPHLNGHYTVFGRITEGWDVLTAIENIPVDEHSRPKTEVKILHAEVLHDSPSSSHLSQSAVIGIALMVLFMGAGLFGASARRS